MSKKQKLTEKLLNRNSSLTWDELIALLQQLGYKKREGSGSRVKFDNGHPDMMIHLHKPHPDNHIKKYMRDQVTEKLKLGGLIE